MTNAVVISTSYEAPTGGVANAVVYMTALEVLTQLPASNTTANVISTALEVPTFNFSTAYAIGTYLEVLCSPNNKVGVGMVTVIT